MPSPVPFRKFFFLMYIANICLTGVTYTFFYLGKSLPLMQASATFTMIVITMPRITAILAMLIMRKYSDTIPKQKMSLITALVTLVVFGSLSFTTGKVWLVMIALLYGVTLLGQGYLSAIILDRTAPQDRTKIYGFFSTSSSLSSIFGATLTDILYPIGVHGQTEGFPIISTWGFLNPLNWQVDINPNFMMLAGVILATVWIIMNITVRKYEKVLPFYGAVSKEDKDYKPPFMSYKLPMLMMLLLGIMWMTEMSLIPGLSVKMNISHSSLFFTGFAILAVIGRFLILPKTDQWGRRNIIYFCWTCYVLSFIAILFLYVMSSTSLLLFAGLICGLGHGVLFSIFNVIFSELTPKYTGNASFVCLIMFFLGCLLVMPLGLLVDSLGYFYVFSGVLILLLTYLGLSFTNQKLQTLLKGNFNLNKNV